MSGNPSNIPFVLLGAAFLFVVVVSAGKQCTSYPCLIFEDNFDKIDDMKWQHEINCQGGGNNEFQCYENTRDNSYIKDGVLHLKPTVTEVYPYIHSARLNTNRSFAFRYGRLEIRAKMPLGDWIWPALWLLPRGRIYGGWPACGEIDLVESRGNAKLMCGLTNVGVNQFGSTMHFGPYWPHNAWAYAHGEYNAPNGGLLSDEWHLYRLDWDREGLKFFIDDQQILEVGTGFGYWVNGKFARKVPESRNPWKKGNIDAPFDQDFYIIMNVAVGGTNGYFPDGCLNKNYPKPWKHTSEAKNMFIDNKQLWYPTWPQNDERAMRVDYVRVWKMSEDQDK